MRTHEGTKVYTKNEEEVHITPLAKAQSKNCRCRDARFEAHKNRRSIISWYMLRPAWPLRCAKTMLHDAQCMRVWLAA